MQHVNALAKPRDVEDSVLEPCVNTNLPDAGANARDWFPVVGIEPLLNSTQLKSCNAARVWGPAAKCEFISAQALSWRSSTRNYLAPSSLQLLF